MSAAASPATVFSRTPTNRAEKQSKHEGKKYRRKQKDKGGMSVRGKRERGM